MTPLGRRLATGVLLGGASLALTLLLIEGILRLAYPAQTRFEVWPHGLTRITHPDPAYVRGVEGSSVFAINSQGIRGPELGSDDEYRILAIGGSTTECMYLDGAEAWPEGVRVALPRTAGGAPVWLGSVGRSGLNSRDHVVELEHLAAQYPRLDAVLVLVGVNDLTVALAQGDHYEAPPPISDPEAERRQIRRAFAVAPGRLEDVTTDDDATPDAPWFKKTAVYQLLKRARAALTSRSSKLGLEQDVLGVAYDRWRDHRRHASAVIDSLPDLTAPLVEYRRNLDLLADTSARRGIVLVLMTQPTLWRADLPAEAADTLWLGGTGDFQVESGKPYYSVPALAEAMRRYNDVLLDVCRARALPCLDLAIVVPRDPSMLYDDCHFTEAGSRTVAAAVTTHLKGLPPFAGATAAP